MVDCLHRQMKEALTVNINSSLRAPVAPDAPAQMDFQEGPSVHRSRDGLQNPADIPVSS